MFKDDIIKRIAYEMIDIPTDGWPLKHAEAAYDVVEEMVGWETLSMKLGHPDDVKQSRTKSTGDETIG